MRAPGGCLASAGGARCRRAPGLSPDAARAGHCQSAGTIVHAEIARQDSGRSKGWGLVDYASPADAANVRAAAPPAPPRPRPSRAASPSPAAPSRRSPDAPPSRPAFWQAIALLHNTEIQGRPIIVRLERAGERPAKAAAASNGGAAPGGSGGGGGARKQGAGSIANSGRPEASSGLQVVVRNLPWTTTSDDLREVFQQVGSVVRAEAVCHADTGRSKGWGTVLFDTPEQAQAAIAGFNGVELEGRPMQIKLDRYA